MVRSGVVLDEMQLFLCKKKSKRLLLKKSHFLTLFNKISFCGVYWNEMDEANLVHFQRTKSTEQEENEKQKMNLSVIITFREGTYCIFAEILYQVTV